MDEFNQLAQDWVEDTSMVLDLNSVAPKPADWFAPNIRYEGRGRAEFLYPKGAVEGPATAYFDEFGNSSIDLTVDSFGRQAESHFGVGELIAGHKEVRNGNVVSLGFGTETNSCTSFSLQTDEGVFSATDRVVLQGYTLGETTNLSFHALRSRFYEAATHDTPTYWVVPLSNFSAEVRFRHPDLDRHPLRIFQTPSVPAGLDKEPAVIAAIRGTNVPS
jgi:hypothetical protein